MHIISAIENFPVLTNITEICSWFAMVNHVSYAFAQPPMKSPFCDLNKHKKFYWGDALELLFHQRKCLIIEQVKSFDINKLKYLSTDWSKHGIGFILLQQHCKCPSPLAPQCGNDHWKVMMDGSQFSTDTETRYAPIEGDLEFCLVFAVRCPNLLVTVDDKLLSRIFNDCPIESIKNPWMQALKEHTMLYRFSIKHIPRALHASADTECPASHHHRYP